jgi:fructosamine-3-kinase
VEPYVKHGSPSTPPDYFAVEAAGLRWLAAVPDGVAVVGVQSVEAKRIVLDRLETARPTPEAADAFGRALARTHAGGAAAFGAPPEGWVGDGFIGRQRMTMRPDAHWGTFFAEQRVLPYAREAYDIDQLSAAALSAVERVADRLRAGDFDDGRPPARIHGDLWSGNVVFTAGGVVVIDPAAHGGHGLTDLAMLHLFGVPGLDRISAAYAEVAGLDPGWRDLVGLHQLHPLLVHAVSHGPAYGSEAASVAHRYR